MYNMKGLRIHIFSLFCVSFLLLANTFSLLAQVEHTAVLEPVRTSILKQHESDSVKQFEKLEIGVQLPASLQREIEKFFISTAAGEREGINPFLEWEIRVFATFKHEQNPSKTIEVDGFFTREFTSYMLDPLPKPSNGVGKLVLWV